MSAERQAVATSHQRPRRNLVKVDLHRIGRPLHGREPVKPAGCPLFYSQYAFDQCHARQRDQREQGKGNDQLDQGETRLISTARNIVATL